MRWIIWVLKGLFKDTFFSPGPNMTTRNHESRLSTPILFYKVFLIQVVEDLIPTIRKWKEISNLFRTN